MYVLSCYSVHIRSLQLNTFNKRQLYLHNQFFFHSLYKKKINFFLLTRSLNCPTFICVSVYSNGCEYIYVYQRKQISLRFHKFSNLFLLLLLLILLVFFNTFSHSVSAPSISIIRFSFFFYLISSILSKFMMLLCSLDLYIT